MNKRMRVVCFILSAALVIAGTWFGIGRYLEPRYQSAYCASYEDGATTVDEIAPDTVVTQDITLWQDSFAGLEVMVGQWGRFNTSSLTLTLTRLDTGEQIGQTVVSGPDMKAVDAYVSVRAAKTLTGVKGVTLRLTAATPDGAEENMMTLYCAAEDVYPGELTVNGETREGDLNLRLSDGSRTLDANDILGAVLMALAAAVVLAILAVRLLGVPMEEKLAARDLRRTDRRRLPALTTGDWCFLLACFLTYFAWSVATGFDFAPDEYMRYDIPKFIYNTGALPTGWEESLRNADWGISYGFFITLPYMLGALFMHIVGFFTKEPNALLLACRFVSVLAGTGVVYYAIRISHRFFKSPIRWAFLFLIAFMPQMMYLSGYVNNDIFGLMTAAFLIDAWLTGFESKFDVRACLRMGVGLSLCYLSYQFAYMYMLCSFLLYCGYYLLNRKELPFRKFVTRGLIILGVFLVLCGWHIVRGMVLYGATDPMGMAASDAAGNMYAREDLKPMVRATAQSQGQSIGDFLSSTKWLNDTLQSFVAMFGYWSILGDIKTYLFYFITVAGGLALALAGGVVHAWQRRGGGLNACAVEGVAGRNRALLHGMLLLAMAGTFVLGLWLSYAVDYQPQGRYIIDLLPPLMLYVTCGLRSLAQLLACGLRVKPRRVERALCVILCGAIVLIAICNFANLFIFQFGTMEKEVTLF